MNIGIIISIYSLIVGLILYIIKITADYTGTKKDLESALKDIDELKSNNNSLIRLEENLKYLQSNMQKIEEKLDFLIGAKNGNN